MQVPVRIQTRMTLAVAVAATVLLSGCATSYVVDNQVQTFSELRTVPQPALASAGSAAARYSVLIGSDVVSTTQLVDPWVYSRFGPWGPYYGRRWAGGAGFYGWGPYWSYRNDMWDRSYVQRQVSVVIRDLSNQQVVYETRAVHESRWPNDPDLLAPMFDAALSSFPQPPAQRRP